MEGRKVQPLSQAGRPPCSVPLRDADLGLDNANWTKGLQAMSDWIWSGNLNPAPFPNNLARYFLQVPGIFEQQLYFSTSLIFDEPSFRNGIQVSGFIERPVRELAISLTAQRRRCWYSMTHHAVLGFLTATKHGEPAGMFTDKMVKLTEHAAYPESYTPVEQEVLKFADAFATDPKAYSDIDRLKSVLRSDNERRYKSVASLRRMARLNSARVARASGLLEGLSGEQLDERSKAAAADATDAIPADVSDRMVNAQLVELAFLCLQFVALSDVFTGLNVPDEDFLADTMVALLPPPVIERINELNGLGGEGLVRLVPDAVELPLDAIAMRQVEVEPSAPRGAVMPLVSYEAGTDLDKGLTVGGVQVGVYGWSFGAHFPGGLVYCLMNHPELARFEAPYSLPLLFNEDEWRNGTQTAGFVTRRLKEIVYLTVYTTIRCRYGLEHHTMFLYNSFFDEHGVNRPPKPQFDAKQQDRARTAALARADSVVLYAQNPNKAPRGTYSDLELATMAWTKRILTAPHSAHELEADLRKQLDRENRREVAAGLRELDLAPGIGAEAAHARLLDHQVAELAMNVGHMDGLGRAMTMLRLESEAEARVVKGKPGPGGGTLPDLAKNGTVQLTGVYNDRPSLFQIYGALGIGKAALTANELRLNPKLNEVIKKDLSAGEQTIKKTAAEAVATAEF
jgi:alkylhydroperoxidase family enzyme